MFAEPFLHDIFDAKTDKSILSIRWRGPATLPSHTKNRTLQSMASSLAVARIYCLDSGSHSPGQVLI
jgi:hypothetical protein